MSERIETFEDFLKRIVVIVFWLLLLLPVIVFPLLFLVMPYLTPMLPMQATPNELFILLINPVAALPMLDAFMKTEFFKLVVFPGFTFASLYAVFIGLWERKLLAKMQLRIGPLYAGRFEGILQPIADAIKLMFKEIIIPDRADRLIFIGAPLGSVAIASALLAVIPVSPNWFIINSDFGLLIAFAIIGFFPLTAMLAGWASNSKYPFIGALRALYQLVSYEIPLLLSGLGVVILTGSMNLIKIVEAQNDLWFLFLTPIGAIIFFVGALAELERIPFDLPEAETELVAGWLTEYSSMMFGMIIGIAMYVKFYAMAAIFTVLFLGGWYGPPFLPPEVWFVIKSFIVVTLMIIPRGVLPRIRIDILIRTGWARLLILSFLNIFLALAVVALGLARPGV